MLRAIIPLCLVAAFASAEDSPLVALAKRTNHKASKRPVITNETVAASRGWISIAFGETTASSMTPAVASSPSPIPPPSPTVAAPANLASPTIPSAAATQTSSYPSSTVRNIEPASSVTTVAPESTTRTTEPSSGAGRIDIQSTARTIEPDSTVHNSQPQTSKPPQ